MSGETAAPPQSKPAPAAPAPNLGAGPVEVTLKEFCVRLSATDKRVALIGGFFHAETAARHVKDTEANFRARYAAFITKPV